MTTTKSAHRSLAILNMPKPALAAVAAAITALQNAEVQAVARTRGAVTARNDQKAALVALLQQLRTYVQTVADADPENSAAIIQSAGFAVRKTPVRKPRVFAAVQGAVSGTVKLITAAAGHRASYDWEYSTDGGKTWVLLPSTLQAKTSVAGLAAGTTVQFRFRAVTKTGETVWSQPVSLLVK